MGSPQFTAAEAEAIKNATVNVKWVDTFVLQVLASSSCKLSFDHGPNDIDRRADDMVDGGDEMKIEEVDTKSGEDDTASCPDILMVIARQDVRKNVKP